MSDLKPINEFLTDLSQYEKYSNSEDGDECDSFLVVNELTKQERPLFTKAVAEEEFIKLSTGDNVTSLYQIFAGRLELISYYPERFY